jgi:hypothetical protein
MFSFQLHLKRQKLKVEYQPAALHKMIGFSKC